MAKTDITTTTAVDPRRRMKEIREDVNSFLKGKGPAQMTYLSELPDNMDDARRVIIALHDLLEKERKKHDKATDHICKLKYVNESLADYQQHCHEVIRLRGRTINLQDHMLRKQEQAMHDLHQTAAKNNHELNAVLTTMKLLGKV